jgi:MFS family permease
MNIRHLILLVSILSLSTFSCGYTIAYIIALGYKSLNLVYGEAAVVNVVRAFLIAVVPFGISFGMVVMPWILKLGSRRYCFQLCRNLALTLSLFTECLLGVIQIQHLAAFFIVRLFQGIITGMLIILIPLYIKEITPR